MTVLATFTCARRRLQLFGVLAATSAMFHLPSASQPAGSPGLAARHFVCRVVYAPAKTLWIRELTVEYTNTEVTRVRIDGVPAHGFSHQGTVLSTHLDNERIQVDLNPGLWRSEFRDRAEGEGICIRNPGR